MFSFWQKDKPHTKRIKIAYKLLKLEQRLPAPSEVKCEKSEEKARVAVKRGDSEYLLGHYMKSLLAYNEALCWAPLLNCDYKAAAYCGRAMVYYKLEFFALCRKNIELAGHGPHATVIQENLNVLGQRCERNRPDRMELFRIPDPPVLSHPPNPKIPCVVADVEFVDNNDAYGRHLVAGKNLLPGDVILNEEPFARVLHKEDVYAHCYHCGKMDFLNLIPCSTSTKVMFCSVKCRDEAWGSYFLFESEIVDGLLDFIEEPQTLLALRIILKALAHVDYKFTRLKNLIQSITDADANPFNLDYRTCTELDKFRVIYSLEAHENDMNRYQGRALFENCAQIWYMLKNHSTLGRKIKKHEEFFLRLLVHFARIVRINCVSMWTMFQKRKADVNVEFPTYYGSAIYTIFSFMSHSCHPNVTRIPENVFAACLHINSGDKITFSYLFGDNNNKPVHIRQEMLKKSHFFECSCIACEDNFSVDEMKEKDRNDGDFLSESLRSLIYNLYEPKTTSVELAKKTLQKVGCELQILKRSFPCYRVYDLLKALNESFMQIYTQIPLDKILDIDEGNDEET